MKPTLIILIGESATGKTTFRQNWLETDGLFYSLRSATTRPMRILEGETEGNPYFFREEPYFGNPENLTQTPPAEPLATYLWVNEDIWKEEGGPKWLYAVPVHEILDNLGRNMVYDVIQPRYAAQLIDWFRNHEETANYDIKVAWFTPPKIRGNVVKERANMPNDKKVRDMNTCTEADIKAVGLTVDYKLCPREEIFDAELYMLLFKLRNNMMFNR